MSENIHIIDLRSDTYSKPNERMREAMKNAEVGNAVFDEDPTINKLQEEVAKLLGKEASLFFPSGVMCNLASVMSHCHERGSEMIVGEMSHYHMWEQGGASQLAGVYVKQIPNLSDGTFSLEKLVSMIGDHSDNACCKTKLICLENTHNYCGGRILPLNFIEKVAEICIKNDIKLHLDGSRVMNAAIASNIDVKEICKHFDSINLCFSKGIGAPVGSILVGSKELIKRAARARLVLGGAMRQSGILAAAALVGLEEMYANLKQDHINAKTLADGINKRSNGLLEVDLNLTETNIVHARITNNKIDSNTLINRLSEVTQEELAVLQRSLSVKLGYIDKSNLRILTYRDITENDIQLALNKIEYVTKSLIQ